MPKTKINIGKIEELVMEKVKSNQISIKPRWLFVLGSMVTFIGLVGLIIESVFLTNLTLFLVRQHGPMSGWRLQQILNSIPWWIPVLAIVGTILGLIMLKKYDFSYKKNYRLILVGLVISVILAAWFIDCLGLNENWSNWGPTKGFYQQLQNHGLKNPKNFNTNPIQGQNDNGDQNYRQRKPNYYHR